MLLWLRQIEDFGDLGGRAVTSLRGRQQAHVLRQLDLWSLRSGDLALTPAKPTAFPTRLERLARYGEARDEEVAFLLLELRQFANADGRLPVSFDPVIRESFGELLHVAV